MRKLSIISSFLFATIAGFGLARADGAGVAIPSAGVSPADAASGFSTLADLPTPADRLTSAELAGITGVGDITMRLVRAPFDPVREVHIFVYDGAASHICGGPVTCTIDRPAR